MSSETQIQLVGHYPTDPTAAIQEVLDFFTGKSDYPHLVHGLYDLLGFGLRLTLGEPNEIMVDPAIVADAIHRLTTAMAKADATSITIPDWMKPLLKQAITLLLTWLQGQLTVSMFKLHGVISKVPVPG